MIAYRSTALALKKWKLREWKNVKGPHLQRYTANKTTSRTRPKCATVKVRP